MQEIQTKLIIVSRLTGEQFDSMEQVPKDQLRHCRIQRDWNEVPSQTDQSARDENNINVLMERHKPDELAQYLAMKSQRPEIVGHDFSAEPDLQGAMNTAYEIKKTFETLPEDIQKYFDRRPAEFLKFAENPKNLPQLKLWGLTKESSVKPEESGKPAKGVPEETSLEVK